MPASVPDGDHVFGTTWVHLYEEDTGEGAVYGPENEARLSRRPRERLVLNAEGSASVFVSGPDDRPVEQSAKWTQDGETFVVRTHSGKTMRVVRRSPSRLMVQSQTNPQTQGGSAPRHPKG